MCGVPVGLTMGNTSQGWVRYSRNRFAVAASSTSRVGAPGRYAGAAYDSSRWDNFVFRSGGVVVLRPPEVRHDVGADDLCIVDLPPTSCLGPWVCCSHGWMTVPVVSVHPFRSIPYTGSGVSVHPFRGFPYTWRRGRRSAGLS